MDELCDFVYVVVVVSYFWIDLDENFLYEQVFLQVFEEMGDRVWVKSNICFGEIFDY